MRQQYTALLRSISIARSWCTRLASLVLLLSFAASFPGLAHEIRPLIGTVQISEDRKLVVTLSLNLEAAMAGIGPSHDDTDSSPAAPQYARLRGLPPNELASAFEKSFVRTLKNSVQIGSVDHFVPLSVSNVSVPPVGDLDLVRISEIRLTGQIPWSATTISWKVDSDLADSVVRLLAPGTAETIHSAYVPAGETGGPFPLDEFTPQSWSSVFLNYLQVGFVHILPLGLDHILFIVGLFLLSPDVRTLLWQVSAFTVAHTITLFLGAANFVSISPAIVEPLIAASIVYVAVENVFTRRLHRWRTALVFGFGLLHGLGFAGVLDEVGLSATHFVSALVAFNIGVELGQLAVIVACLAVVSPIVSRPWYRRAITIPASVVIALIGTYWAISRVGLPWS